MDERTPPPSEQVHSSTIAQGVLRRFVPVVIDPNNIYDYSVEDNATKAIVDKSLAEFQAIDLKSLLPAPPETQVTFEDFVSACEVAVLFVKLKSLAAELEKPEVKYLGMGRPNIYQTHRVLGELIDQLFEQSKPKVAGVALTKELAQASVARLGDLETTKLIDKATDVNTYPFLSWEKKVRDISERKREKERYKNETDPGIRRQSEFIHGPNYLSEDQLPDLPVKPQVQSVSDILIPDQHYLATGVE